VLKNITELEALRILGTSYKLAPAGDNLEMKHKFIISISGMLRSFPMKDQKDDLIVICFNLLRFAYDKKLLKIHPFNEKGKLIINTSIYEDDLTPFGEIIFNDLMYDWLYYADNKSGKIDRKSNIKMLDKYYNKLVSKYQEELNKVALWQNLYEKILKEPLLLSNP